MPRTSVANRPAGTVKARALGSFEHEGRRYGINNVVDVDEQMLLPHRDVLDADPSAAQYAEKELLRAASLRELTAEIGAFE